MLLLFPGAAEAQRLLAELDALKSSFSSSSSSSSQAGCQAELAAAVAQTSRARAQAQAAAEAQASAERAAAAATREAVTSSASSGAYHSSESSSSGSVVSAQAFDIDSYRTERLAATQPNIIECAEAGEGKSQETCHLPKAERFASIGQKGVTVWMTGLSGSGKSTIAKALERHLVVELGLSVQNLDGDNGARVCSSDIYWIAYCYTAFFFFNASSRYITSVHNNICVLENTSLSIHICNAFLRIICYPSS